MKAQKMWARPSFYVRPDEALSRKRRGTKGERPVFVISRTPDAYEAMTIQMAKALTYTSAIEDGERPAYANAMMKENWRNGLPDAVAALASLGIKRPANDAGREEK